MVKEEERKAGSLQLDWDDLWQPNVSELPDLTEEEIEEIKKEHQKLGIKD